MVTKSNTVYAPGTEQDHHGFPNNAINYIFIDTNPAVNSAGDVDLADLTTGTWARLASGILSVTYSSNETTTNDQYMDGDGYGDTSVDAKRGSLALTGNRNIGDPAQEYISGKLLAIGNSVRTRMIWIENGNVVVTSVTLSNIVTTGGNANAKQTFSLTINFNGRPRTVAGTLTMTESETTPKIYTPSLSDAKPTADTPQGVVVDSASEVTANTDPTAANPADHSTTPSTTPSTNGSSGSSSNSGTGK